MGFLLQVAVAGEGLPPGEEGCLEEVGLVLQCEELLYFLASDTFGESTQGVTSLLVEAGTFAMGNEGLAMLEEGEVAL